MYVSRAKCFCPRCFTTQEVWFYKGLIEPSKEIQCTNCATLYDADDFIYSMLNLREETTVSAVEIAKTANIFLPVC